MTKQSEQLSQAASVDKNPDGAGKFATNKFKIHYASVH